MVTGQAATLRGCAERSFAEGVAKAGRLRLSDLAVERHCLSRLSPRHVGRSLGRLQRSEPFFEVDFGQQQVRTPPPPPA